MGVACHNLVSGTSVIRRRPARFGVATGLIILYLYFFVWCEPPIRLNPRRTKASIAPLDEIPSQIWQIFFGYTPLENFAPQLQTWVARNQDYAYTLVSSDGADAFARKHYADQPEILDAFLSLKVPVLRSDLLRYMILESEGGVYSDLDTVAIKPVRNWIPLEQRSKIHAIIGVEYDQLDNEPYVGMTERLQFCQWTMAASRGHPIMKQIVQKVVHALHTTAKRHNTSIAEFKPSDDEVVDVSGPVIWTQTIMQILSELTDTRVDYKNLTGMTEARLIGDVLVLPIDGFGTGQPHSNARTDESGDTYTRHLWKGSWKHGWDN